MARGTLRADGTARFCTVKWIAEAETSVIEIWRVWRADYLWQIQTAAAQAHIIMLAQGQGEDPVGQELQVHTCEIQNRLPAMKTRLSFLLIYEVDVSTHKAGCGRYYSNIKTRDNYWQRVGHRGCCDGLASSGDTWLNVGASQKFLRFAGSLGTWVSSQC